MYCVALIDTAIGKAGDSVDRSVALPPLSDLQCEFNVYGSPLDKMGCTKVAFSLNATASSDVSSDEAAAIAIMKDFAAASSLSYGSDVSYYGTPEDIATAMYHDTSSIVYAVNFLEITDELIHTEVWCNATSVFLHSQYPSIDPLFDAHGHSGMLLAVVANLEAAIAHHVVSPDASSPPSVNVLVNNFDVIDAESDFESGFPTMVLFGPTFMAIGVTIQSIIAAQFVFDERDANLVKTMNRQGMSSSSYWLSWLLAYFILSLGSAALTTAWSSYLDVDGFENSDFAVQFVLLSLYSTSMTCLTLGLSSPLPQGSALNFLKFFLLFISTFYSLFMSLIPGSWQAEENPTFAGVGKFFYSIFPFFHYGRALNVILLHVANTTKGDFEWDNIGDGLPEESYELRTERFYYTPSGIDKNINWQIANIFIYLTVAWYTSQVFAGVTGASKSPIFVLFPSFWGFKSTDARPDSLSKAALYESATDSSLKTVKVSKNYGTSQALKEVTMTIPPNKVFALLGHNGAGKSTLLNILSGAINPTYGKCYAMGLDVGGGGDVGALQEIVSFCPQDDTLWQDLTPKEHIYIVGRFKGYSNSVIEAEIDRVLSSVGLMDVAGHRVSSFSGGMKRRLSLALAMVGDAKIIFLDEPTTVSTKPAFFLFSRSYSLTPLLLSGSRPAFAEAIVEGDREAQRGACRDINDS
jgi:ABC-type lipoprotein export system ATPase subunit